MGEQSVGVGHRMAAGEDVSSKSKIGWTNSTWNPVTGCTPISEGCRHCYARTFAERWRGIPGHPYEQGFDFRLWPERFVVPTGWKKPRMIFVCSMADLFQENVPDAFIRSVYGIMRDAAPQHIYQVLTKRPERLLAMWNTLSTAAHIWHGVTIEHQETAHRMAALCALPSKVRFVSCEPLLGPVEISGCYIERLKWIIVGGETGSGARRMDIEWVRDLRDTALAGGIPFFFKHWGPRKQGRYLDGRKWSQMPQDRRE